MGFTRAVLWWLVALPAPGLAQSITLEIHPDADPRRVVACTLHDQPPMMRAVEVEGTGLPGNGVYTWVGRPIDRQLLYAALSHLMADPPQAGEIYRLSVPAPPYTIVTWSVPTFQGPYFGAAVKTGVVLPPQIARVFREVMPGGLCNRLLP